MISLIRTDSNHPDFAGLIRLLDDDLNLRYGIVQAQYDEFNKMDGIKHVVVALLDKLPVGCGAFKLYNKSTAEIKRMYVLPDNRRAGIGQSILLELEKWAAEEGFSKTILETGVKQPEAIRMYKRAGYSQINNYGQYAGNANSVCMEKKLLTMCQCANGVINN